MDDARGLEAFPRATLTWQKEENRKSAAHTRGCDTLLTGINVRLRTVGPCIYHAFTIRTRHFPCSEGIGKYFVNGACSASHRSDLVATVTAFLSCGQVMVSRNHGPQPCA
jgi:hypothetical protein